MTNDALWEDFHRVVNMTSRELSEWLRTQSAQPHAEELPDQAGSPTGQHVLRILRKRKADLTDADLETIAAVVAEIHIARRDDLEPEAGDEAWRHRLMNIGHDPLRSPSRSGGG